jgi:leucyl-tRNA synthetase
MDWDNEVKLGQKNWINKKKGLNIHYKIDGLGDQEIICFTTRPDTNFGATFVVLAPEHEFVQRIIKKEIAVDETTYKAITEYVNSIKNKSDIERISEGKEKTGAFTGYYCTNTLNNKKLPIWISDFVLGHFGTGAVVGVPAHDKRDFEFAKKFDIEVIRVVIGDDGDQSPITNIDQVQESNGKMIDSDFLNGMDIHNAVEAISEHIIEKGWGERILNFNLRDWCVSRQRYWGPPIPMIHCEECEKKGESWFTHSDDAKKMLNDAEFEDLKNSMKGWYPDENLPIKLPEIASLEAIKPDGSGKGPLASQIEFVKAICPNCGANASRETDVSDPFVDSCWYFLRYPFTDYENIPFGGNFDSEKSMFKANITDEEKQKSISRMKKWGPVNSYIGGKEHTVLHLLYSRFITMALHDLGYLDFEEPFNVFYGHGLITKDGAKMSKSKGNVVNPDEYVEKYGADSIRLYLRFIGPFDQAGDWRDTGMDGMYKFVKKLWAIFHEDLIDKNYRPEQTVSEEAMVNATIKEVGEDIDELRYNTAIAHIMKYVNWYQESKEKLSYDQRVKVLTALALVLAPFAPHIADEFWTILGYKSSIHLEKWPEFDLNKTIANEINIAIQVNGKVRGAILIERGSDQVTVENQAKAIANIDTYLQTGIKRVIFVKDKIINFIV